jgi:hypothetical protein
MECGMYSYVCGKGEEVTEHFCGKKGNGGGWRYAIMGFSNFERKVGGKE